ncbi:MAG: hypothetical protein CL844_09910 [Crocinitomicaceae bacterium]|nr:hypothetical protein [Crocinitomicaceae bacterium]|tara:strand:+ start:43420 stop:47055 length:3636 start_codon:yes stop_codon:yes gene_type:complete
MLNTILRKYYILFLAVFCTIFFALFFFKTYSENYKGSVRQFQNEFISLEKVLENALRIRSKEIKNNGIEGQWKREVIQDRYSFHVYHRDSLVFWNTNQLPIIRFADIHYPASGLLHLQNGWYYARLKTFDDYVICASKLIKQEYSYKNNELVNDFAPNFNLSFSASISLEEEVGFPIYSNSSKYVFSILPNIYQEATFFESIIMFLLLFISLIFWLLFLRRIIVPLKWDWCIPTLLVYLRFLSLKFTFFGFMHDTSAFDPSLYATNRWLPNFFEYLVNILVLIFLLDYITKRIVVISKSKFKKYFALVLLLISFFIWALILYLTKTLVDNSSIPLVIDKLFSLNIYSIIAITSIGALFYFYFKLVKGIIEIFYNHLVSASKLAVFIFLCSLFYFFFEINYGYELFLAAIFPLIFYEFVLYLVYRLDRSNNLNSGIILLFIFSIVMAFNLSSFNNRKEKGERELYANQLATEKNIVTEVEYTLIKEKISRDNYLKRLISYPRAISMSKFQARMERRFYKGFWERYEMEFYLFDSNYYPIIDAIQQGTEKYENLQGVIERSGVISKIDSNVFFINDYTNQYSYLIRQKIIGKNKEEGVLFCTLKSKKIPEKIGFPRLLVSSKANVFEPLESYSIVKYHNGRMITKYGGFNYPSSYNFMIPSKLENKGFFDYMGYNHYVLKKSSHEVLILSKKKLRPVDYITSFSYLFTLYGILLLPLIFIPYRDRGFGKTFSLALKIQVGLISLVFLSLFAFGWGSGVFVSDQYNELTDDVIKEKLKSVETEIKSKLSSYDKLSILDHGNYIQVLLQNFSKVFFTDINMYDKEGYLLATSRPKVFNVGLISEQINSNAYQHLKFLRQSEFIHFENIGQLKYSSAYKPFYSSSGNLMGYINLQHFGQQRDFENQIQKFLVAIVNVFIFLLAISIIIAIFISNWLTEPLRILQNSFSQVKFGKHNQPISYDKEDEIGSLVKEYNKKLAELQHAAQKLAQSEREIAWREMAKQVAHEIKNPLTPMKLSVQQLLRTYNQNDPNSTLKVKKVANSMIEQIDSLTRIANEFSTFAKMPYPSKRNLDIIKLISHVIEVFASNVNTSVTYRSNREEVFLLADKNQFIRVFNNLLKNSIQAIPDNIKGEVSINIDAQDKYVIITVSDNGVGISKEQYDKIFVPNFTTKTTGAGLGLAMVKQIVENHLGEITFKSIIGSGTNFIIKLPLNGSK